MPANIFSNLDRSSSRCLRPAAVNLKIRTGRFLAESPISDFSQPVFNMRCKAGYNEPSSIWRRSSDTALMCCTSAYPCIGFRFRVCRIINSKAPAKRSRFSDALTIGAMVHRKYYFRNSIVTNVRKRKTNGCLIHSPSTAAIIQLACVQNANALVALE
jgi:hypothetical protein